MRLFGHFRTSLDPTTARDHTPGGDHLDDLRADLPEPYCSAPDVQVGPLWAAWTAARHGHDPRDLIRTCHVPADTAARLVELAAARRAR